MNEIAPISQMTFSVNNAPLSGLLSLLGGQAGLVKFVLHLLLSQGHDQINSLASQVAPTLAGALSADDRAFLLSAAGIALGVGGTGPIVPPVNPPTQG